MSHFVYIVLTAITMPILFLSYCYFVTFNLAVTKEICNFVENCDCMNIRSLMIILLGGATLFMSSCGKGGGENKAARRAAQAKARAEEQAAFKVAVTPTLDCLPFFLMKDSMLYDSTKVDLRLKPFNAHIDIDTAFVGGSVQTGATELVRAVELRRTHRVQMRAIAVTPLQWTLVGDKHNKITSLKSLANHMVAMSRFSATDWLTTIARKRAKTDDIIFSVQINDVNLRKQMILNDEMDAAWLPEPQATAALGAGNVALAKSDDEGRNFGVIVFLPTINDDASQRERQLEAVKTAYDKAVKLINTHGLKYYKALIKKYMGVDDKTISRLPKVTFPSTGGAARADILAAEKITFQKHTPRVKIQ